MTALILLSEFQKTEIELWRPVAGFVGFEVSNLGRIRTFWKNSRRADGGRGSGGARLGSVPRVLRQHPMHGYPAISLKRANGKYRYHYTHRFVAKAFIPNPDNKPEVNHITAFRADGRAANLEWVTGAENRAHAVRNGLFKNGSQRANRRFSDEDIGNIRERAANGESRRSIARSFNVSPQHISPIVLGKIWKHLPMGGSTGRGRNTLSSNQIVEIRERHEAGESGVKLALEYKVTPSTISGIWKKKSWRDVI